MVSGDIRVKWPEIGFLKKLYFLTPTLVLIGKNRFNKRFGADGEIC